MELQNKIVVITGAAGGIGKAMAARFQKEGTREIVVVDINQPGVEATAKELGCVAMTADVSQEADIIRVIEDTEQQIGPIDLFCSNAGIGAGPDLQSPDEEWQRSWSINVMPHVYAARNLVPRMSARGGGYLLNLEVECMHSLFIACTLCKPPAQSARPGSSSCHWVTRDSGELDKVKNSKVLITYRHQIKFNCFLIYQHFKNTEG